MKQHVYIIGSKGIPARYGGFETFVDNLTKYKQRDEIVYHVACMDSNCAEETKARFTYNGADCFQIKVPEVGPAKAVVYDVMAFRECLKDIKKKKIENAIVYVLACRIGPFIGSLGKSLRKQKGQYFVNPDGHEWMRAKWSKPIRIYWKISEKFMIKHADLVICDSKNMEKYIRKQYAQYKPDTRFVAYGTEVEKGEAGEASQKLEQWYKEHGLRRKEYYHVVGRFVPENNYETMIREFMKSDTKKDFVLITNVEKNKFYEQLRQKTGFDRDERIKFVGTVYEKELLGMIRQNAFAYIHGHEVGGTNPSLLEALGSTDLNLLLNVGFNREVAENSALYFSKEDGAMCALMEKAEGMDREEIRKMGALAKERIEKYYSHSYIGKRYEDIFMGSR